jgi:hypothetical protein
MKLRYNREDDILLLEVSDEPIDYAEEMGPLIVHFSKGGKPIILEILDASDFIASAAKSTIQAKGLEPIELQL